MWWIWKSWQKLKFITKHSVKFSSEFERKNGRKTERHIHAKEKERKKNLHKRFFLSFFSGEDWFSAFYVISYSLRFCKLLIHEKYDMSLLLYVVIFNGIHADLTYFHVILYSLHDEWILVCDSTRKKELFEIFWGFFLLISHLHSYQKRTFLTFLTATEYSSPNTPVIHRINWDISSQATMQSQSCSLNVDYKFFKKFNAQQHLDIL